MKKAVSVVLLLALCFGLFACSDSSSELTDNYGHDIGDALDIAENILGNHLDYPGVLQLGPASKYKFICSGSTWTVEGALNYEQTFIVQFTYTNQDAWYVNYCETA